MDSFEWNKVFAAVIASVLLIMVVGIISEMPFHHQAQEKPAFSIEVAQEASAEVVVDEGPSFVELLASADAGRGAREWNKCKACHTVDKGGANKTGPNLYGVIGRTVAALDDFNYSGALEAMGTSIWTYEMMDEWLTNPQAMAKGSKMVYVLRKPEQRANLIAYLSTFTDVQVPFPTPEAVEEAVEAVAEAASGN